MTQSLNVVSSNSMIKTVSADYPQLTLPDGRRADLLDSETLRTELLRLRVPGIDHTSGVARTGEPFHLLDAARLESALARPENHWEYGEDDMLTLAIILLVGIARNHAFLQGNKRTAFISAEMFLKINGYSLQIADSPILGEVLEQLILRQISEEDFHLAVQDYIQETGQQIVFE